MLAPTPPVGRLPVRGWSGLEAPYLPPPLSRAGLVPPVRVDPTGRYGPTRKKARGPGWRRTSHGLYVPSWAPTDDVWQRIAEAAAVVPPGCAITGWAALSWLGAGWFAGHDAAGRDLPVVLVVSTHDVRPQAGIRVSGEGLAPSLVLDIDGVPVTDPRYAVSYEMRYAADERQAVVVMDMAAHSDLVTLEEMGRFLARQRAWTGIPKARRALARAVESSWSPAETEMRLQWLDWFPDSRLLCNPPVFDPAGGHVATPDLLDVDRGVAGEYDSDLHLTRQRRDRDVRREAGMRGVGLEPVTMTAVDRTNPADLRSRLEQARDRADTASRADGWTLVRPEGWPRTDAVELRRILTARRRAEHSHGEVG